MNNSDIRVFTNKDRVNEVEVGKEFKVTVLIPKDIRITNLKILFNMEGEKPSVVKELVLESPENTEEENLKYNFYSASVSFNRIGNFYYYFTFTDSFGHNQALKLGRNEGKPIITTKEAPYWRILVIQDNFSVPDWAKGAIYYQIFVDRFYHGSEKNVIIKGRNYRKWGEMPNFRRNKKGEFHNNDFFCGDIKGVEKKLPYIKSLGVTVIYLSPINLSLYRYDGYAATNHLLIDPNKGTFQELMSLKRKAHSMGIHIILDIALNHCSSDNPIFKDAISNPKSPYRDWFYINSDGSYKYWYCEFKDMPVFNQSSKGYKEYVYGENGIIAKYSGYVDGFRLDVAEELSEETLEGIRKRANEFGKHVIIAEYWNKAPTSYLGKCFDGTTNYPYMNAMYKWLMDGEAEYFAWQIQDLLENYPKEAICTMLNSIDTHDTVRALTIIGGKWMRHGYDRRWDIDKEPSPWHKIINGIVRFLTDNFRQDEFENDKLTPKVYREAKRILKLLIIMQYTLPGNPCTFYGTEVGSHGYKDPFNRKCFPWDRIDKDILRFYKRIGAMRNQNHKEFKNADYHLVLCNKDILCYIRNNLLIVINRSDVPKKIVLPKQFKTGSKIIFASDNKQKSTKEIMGKTGMIVKAI